MARNVILFKMLIQNFEGQYCTQPNTNTETLANHTEFFKLIFNESQLTKLAEKLKTYEVWLKLDDLKLINDYFIPSVKTTILDLDEIGLDIWEQNPDNSYKYINLATHKAEDIE